MNIKNFKHLIIGIVIGLLAAAGTFVFFDKNDEEEKVTEMTIYIEGVEETINVKKIKSTLGFSIKYDIDRFEIFEEKDQLVIDTIYNDDLIGVTIEKSKSSYEEITTKLNSFEEISLNKYKTARVITSNGGISTTQYYVNTKKGVYVISSYIPDSPEYIEGYGSRIAQMIETFEVK